MAAVEVLAGVAVGAAGLAAEPVVDVRDWPKSLVGDPAAAVVEGIED